MTYFEISADAEYIELIKLLKAENIASSGAEAKMMVEDQLVDVNGNLETRKRAKLREGDIVEIEGRKIQIVKSKT
ncbi:MAG: RNA-binding S4 domain-containing protein [Bacteroidota bacterium]